MREYTVIRCASPESAHALHAYLLAKLAQDELNPESLAVIEGAALRVTHNLERRIVRKERDAQLIGYRDGRESLEATLRKARRVIKELRRSVIDDWQAGQMIDDTVRAIDSALGVR